MLATRQTIEALLSCCCDRQPSIPEATTVSMFAMATAMASRANKPRADSGSFQAPRYTIFDNI